MIYRGHEPESGLDYIMQANGKSLVMIWDGETGKNYKTVRVYKQRGISWGLNEKSVSCSSGQAAQIVEVFRRTDAHANTTFRRLALGL